jgi:hypothetical protein
MIGFTRHTKTKMIVGHVVDAIIRQNAVPGGELDTRFPFLGTDLFANGFGPGYELNGHDPAFPDSGG